MRVLFAVPPFADIYGSYRHLYKRGFVNPPLSLCYLAAALSNKGHTVRIIDGEVQNLSTDDIVGFARSFRPNLLALTATSVDFDRIKVLAQAMKVASPEVQIIIGGVHVNIVGAEVLRDSDAFDFACVGDGEDLVVELATLLEHDDYQESLSQIPGLIFRRKEEIVENPMRIVEKYIDRYPFPARNLLRNELYLRNVPRKGYQQTAAIISSRGCPYSCIYCAVKSIHAGTTVRLRSAENVLDEVDEIVSRLKIAHLSFNDDCLTLSRKRILTICEGIRRRDLKFTWEGLSRADLVDRELLKSMHQAGFVRISFGIESGNPEILKMVQKDETHEQIEHAFRMAHEVGIVTRGSVIIGLPYETRAAVKDTFRFVERLKGIDQVVINILQPYPGTKVREMILRGEGGTMYHDDSASGKNLQRFGKATVSVNDLSAADLLLFQKIGFLRFYLQPTSIINSLRITKWSTLPSEVLSFVRSILGI